MASSCNILLCYCQRLYTCQAQPSAPQGRLPMSPSWCGLHICLLAVTRGDPENTQTKPIQPSLKQVQYYGVRQSTKILIQIQQSDWLSYRTLSAIGETLLAFFLKCRSLIGYASHCLFSFRQWVVWQCAVGSKMTATSLRFRSVCEEGLDKCFTLVDNKFSLDFCAW